MKRLAQLVVACFSLAVPAILLGSVTLVSASCAGQSAAKSYSYTQDAFINANARLLTYRQIGKINDQDWKDTVLPLMREIDAALDQWDAAIKSGSPNATGFANIASAALERLTKYLASKQGGSQ
jgi:hypothetical protein